MSRAFHFSKNQIDRLGVRLRKGHISVADLRLLDKYRRSFGDAYENVIGRMRIELELEPTGRPAKSTTSIIDKLQRESIRLSQMQDIAGCRLTVPDIGTQNQLITRLHELFVNTTVVDRRQRPSHGYRAVHVVVQQSGKLIEVQVRTLLQHLWAESSEKLSDLVDKEIKYGRGPSEIAKPLAQMSAKVNKLELNESFFQVLLGEAAKVEVLVQSGRVPSESKEEVALLNRKVETIRRDIVEQRQALLDIMKALNDGIQEIR